MSTSTATPAAAEPKATTGVWPVRLNVLGITAWGVGGLTGEGLALGGGVLCLLIWVWQRLRAVGLAWIKWPHAVLLAYAAYGLVSSVWAPQPLASGAPWSSLHVLLFPVAVLAWRQLSAQWQGRIALTLLAVAMASTVLALVQHHTLLDYGWLVDILRPTQRVQESNPIGGYMAGGLHFHRLKYAHTLVLLGFGMLPALSWACRRQAWLWVGGGLLLPVFGTALLFTATKAAWGALFGGIVLLIAAKFLGERQRWVVAGGCVAGATLVPLVLPRVAAWPPDRIFAWETAQALFARAPLVGIGYGGYAPAALALHDGPHPEHPLLHLDAHSLVWQILVERGILGFALFVIMLVLYARLLGRLAAPQLAVIGAFFMLGIVHNLAFHPVVVAAAALAVAMGGSRSADDSPALLTPWSPEAASSGSRSADDSPALRNCAR